jgi:hypothetical protein
MKIKAYIKEVLMNERGHREIKLELLSTDEPDWRELIKKQVDVEVLE